MPSPDTVPFTLSEGDAHTSHQNTQQVIESIMQVIKELLKHLNQPKKKKAPPDEEKDPQADEKVISLPELAEPPVIEPVYVQQQTLSLEGANPHLLNAAPPYQLEGQGQQALLPGTSAEQIKPLLVAIRIEVGETAVVGSVLGEDGSDLREALAQLAPAQLEQIQQALESPDQTGDVIDVESEPVRIDGWIEDEQGQTEYLSLVNQEQEAERAPIDSTAADQQESFEQSIQIAGYESYEEFHQKEIDPYLADAQDLVPPWEEKPEPIHTEQLSVEQVESWTGKDFGDSPHLDDVGSVIAQVDEHGRILDKGYVQQQVESRVEEAEEEDIIDEQREASVVEEPEVQRVDTLPSTQEQQAIATLNQLLETVGGDRFEGDRFVLEQQGDLMTLSAKDGRGLILATQGEQVLKSELTNQDFGAFDQVAEVLNRPPELDPGIAVPELIAPEIAVPEFEMG